MADTFTAVSVSNITSSMFFVASLTDLSTYTSYLMVPLEVLDRRYINSPAINKTLHSYDFTINFNATLLTGRQTASVGISGLLTTDRIIGLEPLADLPGNLNVAYSFIPSSDILRVAFSTPLLFTGNNNIDMRLSVLR